MSDPPKFTFGSATPSSSSGNIFGQPASNPPSTGGLFGSATANNTGSGSAGLFGSAPSTAQPKPGGLFGNGAANQPASALAAGNSGSSLFGGAPQPASGGFSFGKPASGNASGGMFGNNQTSSQSNQPAIAALSTGLFGSATPSKPNEKPLASGSSNLFGGGGLSSSSSGTAGGSNLFGNASSTTPANASTPTSKQPTSLFGNSTTPAGPPPATSVGSGEGGGLFSFKKPDQINSNSSNPPTSSLFGNPKSTAEPFKDQNKTSAPPGSGLFGSAPINKSGPNLFGNAGGGQASTGSLFGNTKQNQESSVGQAKSQGEQESTKLASNPFGSIGGQSSANDSTAKTSSAQSLFGNVSSTASKAPTFSFAKASEPPASSASAVQSPGAASSSMFGNLGTKPAASPAASAAPTSSFFPSLNKPGDKAAPTSGESNNTTAATSGAPAPSSNLFGSSGAKSTAATAGISKSDIESKTVPTDAKKSNVLSGSTAGPAPTARSRLKDKTMDDIITRWASDLSKYQKEFQAQAEKVAAWDRALVENSEKIQRLYGSTLEAERATTEVERQLTAVESDQAELEQWLNHYEQEVDTMIQNQVGQGDGVTGPDKERQYTYDLATKLSDRLDDMGKDLGSMIEEINDASSNLSRHAKADDPLTQVVRVLNNHLTQLQQIDQGAATLQLKVKEAQRAGQSMSAPSGLSGPSSDAADSFYRSYMGRT